MRNKRTIWAVLAVSAVLLLGACSSGSSSAGMHDGGSMMGGSMHDHGANSERFPGARTIDVTARSFAFAPKRIAVEAGEKVNIRLTSEGTLHDFTVAGQDVHVVAKAGSTAVGGMRIAKPGTYSFSCTVPGHRAAGMQGTIVVT